MIDAKLISLLKEAYGRKVESPKLETLSPGNSGLFKARITGSANGQRFSAMVKVRQGEAVHAALWYAKDSGIVDREYRLYELLERLRVPHARILARRYDSPTEWALLMEDLCIRYVMLENKHCFSEAEQDIIVGTYAAIHHASRSAPRLMTEAMGFLAPEEGSQVDVRSAEKMCAVLRGAQFGSHRLLQQDFRKACSILFEGRQRWKQEPRVLVFNDFHPSNVALPEPGGEYAILFDWELAGIGFPQFDLQNFWTGRDVDRDRLVAVYIDRSQRLGTDINIDRFMSVMPYAELCRQFYTLWMLYLKLVAEPGGKLTKWMRFHSQQLFSGGLIRLAQEALV